MMKTQQNQKKTKQNYPCVYSGRMNTVKMSILPKAIYTFNAIPIKIVPTFFSRLEQAIWKFAQNNQRTWVVKVMWKKESQSRRQPRLSPLLRSCNHQESMTLAQKQAHEPMKQHREPRRGPTNVWWTNLWQNWKDNPMDWRQSLYKGCWENWTATWWGIN